ncbi:MAG TPA: Na-translocating system protein MpsC family protein [Solirubrobacterales bacterium]|nr:Na-translocating system protein MpsC family protein [Solirubrobacterales bacterium]
MAAKETPKGGHALVELSNAMVALHREHFGRGPGAAKSFVSDEMVISLLSDIYTAVERTLIKAGQAEHVRHTRALHQEALKDEYKASVERIMGRPVTAFLSVVHVDPDVAIEMFLLGARAEG